MRLTRQKRRIREALQQRSDHPTAEDVWLQVRQVLPRISLATVYRCLEQMANNGELARIFPSAGPRRYDLRVAPHAHVTCTECGAVADVHLPPDATACLNQLQAKARSTFELHHLQLSWTGICPECRKRRRVGDGQNAAERSRPDQAT